MAVDKKSDHVGNHGGTYIDNHGMTRQFTYIDHDKKSKMSFSETSDEEKEKIKNDMIVYRKSIIDRILDVPASLCPYEFHDFTIRGEDKVVIEWNKTMISDDGMSIDRLVSFCTLLENRFNTKS